MRSYSSFIFGAGRSEQKLSGSLTSTLGVCPEADCGEWLLRCTPVTPLANVRDCNEPQCCRSPSKKILK